MATEVLAQSPAVPEAPIKPGRLLVIDDDRAGRSLLATTLRAAGYQVAEAQDAFQALDLVRQSPPDVILLDVMLPGMDGLELCRRLKQDPATSHLPVLILTALTSREEKLMGIRAGANDFLVKPIDLEEVLLRVTNAAQTKSLLDQLHAERVKAERLLLNTLPRPIASRMRSGETTIADFHSEITVLVADLVGFTALTLRMRPEELVSLLNEIFSTFDFLAEKHRLEKIKTIGDAYMAAGGLPLPRTDHAEAIAQLALDMLAALEHFNRRHDLALQLRAGICTGPVVAGVIGRRKFAYDLWGDTVNIASRLESVAPPGTIQVSDSTRSCLRHRFRFQPSQTVELRGRPPVTTFALLGRANNG